MAIGRHISHKSRCFASKIIHESSWSQAMRVSPFNNEPSSEAGDELSASNSLLSLIVQMSHMKRQISKNWLNEATSVTKKSTNVGLHEVIIPLTP